jgi:hypothetical protein
MRYQSNSDSAKIAASHDALVFFCAVTFCNQVMRKYSLKMLILRNDQQSQLLAIARAEGSTAVKSLTLLKMLLASYFQKVTGTLK